MPLFTLFPQNITNGPLASTMRFVVALGCTLAAFGLYQVALVPVFEPAFEPVAKPFDLLPSGNASKLTHNNYARFFPAGAWERDKPKMLRTPHGSLLFQDYRTGSNGRLNLHPVTMIVEVESPAAEGQTATNARWVVMQAPEGAELQFQRALSLMSTKAGKLLGGRLRGEVTLWSPPSEPGGNNDLFVRTRNLRITLDRIWTTAAVEFRFGPNAGTGRELLLDFDNTDDVEGHLALGKLRTLELIHLDQLQIEIPRTGKQPLLAPSVPQNPSSTAQATQLQLRCQGPLLFDFLQQTASLEENVQVTHFGDSSVTDRLYCEKLKAFLESSVGARGEKQERMPRRGMVKKIIAVGTPVTLEANTTATRVRCEKLAYDLARRTLQLEDSRFVELKHDNHTVTASQIEYELGKQPHRLGRLWAGGGGQFRQHDKGQVTLQADWTEELRLEPQGHAHVLSLSGGAQLQSAGEGSLAANQIHAWLRQTAPPPAAKTQPNEGRIQLEKMLATGSVQLDSQQIMANVERLEVWLDDLTPTTPPNQPRTAASSSFTPTVPRGGNAATPPSFQRIFRLTSRTAQLHFVRDQQRTTLENASLDGNVELVEIRNPVNPGGSITLAGNHLEMTAGGSNNPKLMLVGSPVFTGDGAAAAAERRPAHIAAEGVALTGQTIQMHQGTNQLWVNGAGRITAQPKTKNKTNGPLQLQWTGHLAFDGQTAAARGQVIIQGKQIQPSGDFSDFVALGEDVRVTLAEKLDFSKPDRQRSIQYQQLFFVGPSVLENRTFNKAALQQSQERLEVSNLSLQGATGKLRADGPGWLSSVRYNRDPLQSAGNGSIETSSAAELFYLDVRFAQEMTGNLDYREVTFKQQVQAVYGPVAQWVDQVSAEEIVSRARPGGVLHSDQLTVADLPDKQSPGVELLARGNIRVEGQEQSGFFTATGHALKYAHHKDLLILEGTGRTFAVLTRQQRIGAEPQTTRLERIVYQPRTNQLNLEGVQSVELNSALPTSRQTPPPGAALSPASRFPPPGSQPPARELQR
ncbi:MAG: hypothetical protein CMJ75_17370 [Planctomycetaceae bacterium]|nr:hypothetical protein [Planctomycetaceae bacterium]